MKEKLIRLITLLGNRLNNEEGYIQIDGPFYVDDIMIHNIRLCNGELEFNIQHGNKCQFGRFDYWIIYPNMEVKYLEKITERLINLI